MPDWRNWPKADWKIADPKSLPDWARSPELRRENLAESLRVLPVVVLGVAAPIAIAYTLFAFFAPSGTGAIATWVGLGSLLSMPVSMLVFGRWGAELAERRLRGRVRDQLEARGEPVLGGELVGVTYSDVVWRDSQCGDSWDWGVLHLEMDRLTYIGRGSRFDLRPQSIQKVEVKQLTHVFGTQARLFITWDDGGKSETLILEMPYKGSRRRRFEEAENLRERIERWRREPLPNYDKTPLIPPPRYADLKPVVNPFSQIGWPAGILAGVALVIGIFVITAGLTLLLTALGFRHTGGFLSSFAIFYFVAWIMVAGAIEKRLPAKWQHPDKRVVQGEPPTIDLGGPIVEEEKTNLTA